MKSYVVRIENKSARYFHISILLSRWYQHLVESGTIQNGRNPKGNERGKNQRAKQERMAGRVRSRLACLVGGTHKTATDETRIQLERSPISSRLHLSSSRSASPPKQKHSLRIVAPAVIYRVIINKFSRACKEKHIESNTRFTLQTESPSVFLEDQRKH